MDKLEQNIEFRAFLRDHTDSDELDAHFSRLHDELFSTFDCCKCSNCCKELNIFIGDDEIRAASEYLDIMKDDFINKYIKNPPIRDMFATDFGRTALMTITKLGK